MEIEALSLTSISGIVISTMFIVEILKRMLSHLTFFQKVPLFVYAVVISGILAYLANAVLTANGSPLLPGSLFKVIWSAIISAGGASGFYSWLRPATPESAMKSGQSNLGPPSTLLILGIMFLGGCTVCPEKAVLRETLVAFDAPIVEDQMTWALEKFELGKITAAQLDQIKKLHAERQAFIDEDRSRK